MWRERERESDNDPLEVDNGPISLLVVMKNGVCKLRNIMPSITFSRNIKRSILVLRKSL